MIRDDELTQTIVLLMQVRTDDEACSTQRTPRLPTDHFLIGNTILLALGPSETKKVQATKEAGGAKYILRTKSKSVCDKLKQIRELADNTPIEIIEHPTLNSVQGVVFDSDGVNLDEEYILKNLQSQGVTSVRRIKKRVGKELQNTPLTVLTFSGAILPDYVFHGLLRVAVRRYYPAPMMCFRCANYGHTRKKCDTTKNEQVCLTCSGTHEVLETPCTNPEHCKNCGQNHSPISKQCAVYREEEKIVRLKIDNNLSYSEARSEVRKLSGNISYAAVANQNTQNLESEKDRIIQALQEQITSLTKMVTDLKTQIASTNQQKCSRSNTSTPNGKQKEITVPSRPEPSHKNCHVELTRSSSLDQLRLANPKHPTNQPNTSAHAEPHAANMEYENLRISKRKGTSNKKNEGIESPERKKCPSVGNVLQPNQVSGVETRSRKK